MINETMACIPINIGYADRERASKSLTTETNFKKYKDCPEKNEST